MKKAVSPSSRYRTRGFALLEPVLAVALLALLALSIVSALVAGRQGFVATAEREQALYLAEEGIEALRSIRDGSFDALAEGEWGLSREGSFWTLEPSPDSTAGRFTRSITITEPEPGVRDVESVVTWDSGGGREVVLQTRLTNWREI